MVGFKLKSNTLRLKLDLKLATVLRHDGLTIPKPPLGDWNWIAPAVFVHHSTMNFSVNHTINRKRKEILVAAALEQSTVDTLRDEATKLELTMSMKSRNIKDLDARKQ